MNTRTAEKRPLGAMGRMGVVAAMHVAVLLLIARSLGIVPAMTESKLEGVFIDEPQAPVDRPPPTPPDLQPTKMPFDVAPPEPPPIASDDPPPPSITTDPPEIPGATGTSGSAEPMPKIVNVRQDARHPLSQPNYDPADIREGNQGSADVEVYVLPNGRVGDARIVKSSGHERLDRATLEEARRNWRLIPATRDGEAIAQWYRLRVVFKLKTQ